MPAVGEDAEAVYWNADYSPYAARRDADVSEALDGRANITHGTVVHRPGLINTAEGQPMRVFTPYHRKWTDLEVRPIAEALPISSGPRIAM